MVSSIDIHDGKQNLQKLREIAAPDVSKEATEKKFNKSIDDGYISSPTNEKFVVTQNNPRGKVNFPLIMILSSLGSQQFREYIIGLLAKVPKIGDVVPVMYISNNRASYLTSTYGNRSTVNILNTFCISFKYMVAKGKVLEDLSFSNLIDYESINKDILIKESIELIEYTNIDDQEVASDIDYTKYIEEIDSIIANMNNTSDADRLVNQPTEQVEPVEEIIENSEIIKHEELPKTEPEQTSIKESQIGDVKSFE